MLRMTCVKCETRRAKKDSLFCQECENGNYAADTGVGLSGRNTDMQGRRRNHK